MDDCCDNPATDGGWLLYSFSQKHASFHDPRKLGIERDGSCSKPGLARKLKVGLAFVLSYFEHGNCCWFLRGEWPLGTEAYRRWDGVTVAGLLIWQGHAKNLGPKDYDGRQRDARGFLKTYTCWCNGEVYGYSIRKLESCSECGHESYEEIDSCYGFYGNDTDYMLETIREQLNGGEVVRVCGDAGHLADGFDWTATEKEEEASAKD